MDSSRQKVNDIAKSFFAEGKSAWFLAQKRNESLAQLDSHVTNGTFPSNLNFKLAASQLPLTIPNDAKTAYDRNRNTIIFRCKQELLNLDREIYGRDVATLEAKRNEYDQQQFIDRKFLAAVPALQNNQELLVEARNAYSTLWSCFKAEQQAAADAHAAMAVEAPLAPHAAAPEAPAQDLVAAISQLVSTMQQQQQMGNERSRGRHPQGRGREDGRGDARLTRNTNNYSRPPPHNRQSFSRPPPQNRQRYNSPYRGQRRSPSPQIQNRQRGRGQGNRGYGNQHRGRQRSRSVSSRRSNSRRRN
jgi:hypothetical protein